jgi:DNA helicase INO80
VTKPSEIVHLLLNDEQLASLESSNRLSGTKKDKPTDQNAGAEESVRDLWNEEGDDFFGHTAQAPAERQDDENVPVASQSTRGKRRKLGATGASRGRKPGSKKKAASTSATPLEDV